MSIISDALSYIGHIAITTISALGYFGVFILMAMESMIFPIPSELVMPFAGFLAGQGRFSFALVILFSSLGSLFGSLISYYIGKYGGNKIVVKYGRFFFLDVSDLKKTEKWFSKKGEKTILFSRFIPVVRHLISIPAGIGKMDLKKFCVYTVIGATIWNTFLAYLGYMLGANWEKVEHYVEFVKIPLVILIIALAGFYIYRHVRDKKKEKEIEEELAK